MKIAALSDIHGNLAALEAVLKDVQRHGADVIVNLGDIFSGALYPSQTADRLMALGFPTIRGNHERQVLSGDVSRMSASDRWAHISLNAQQMEWMRNLPTTLRIENDVLLVHGTPGDDLTYFLETVEESGCRPATQKEVEERAGDIDAGLILCGHTHLQRSMKLMDGRLIVNPGSVGLQAYSDDHPFPHRMEMGSPHARYACITKTSSGWDVEFHFVEYAWDDAAAIALSNGRPDWANALRSGFC
ncbi:metallophosphoesterase family protein [Paraburkholderia sp. JHI2823]|uniref:metallophosphoesterase family protein n=1 Tax=Paraburkholderia sp. JHI2823 TaxID=3112960 RepID=UPI00317A88CD